HTVGECDTDYVRILDAWGIEIRVVQSFDSRHPNSNKLAQLESEALHSAEYVVLFDCDTAFCGDITPWIGGDSIRARIASSAGLPPDRWMKVFREAGLSLPKTMVEAVATRMQTLPTYCNGGFYIIPQTLCQRLRAVWPRWNRWLLDRDDWTRPFAVFTDQ